MKKRRIFDDRRFRQMTANQETLIQLFQGMPEIKLNNIERQKRWEWESIQAKLFKVNVKSLALNQYQQAGATFINESKNILITIFAATAVINGDMTLGMLLAVQYILGQLNSPLDQMIGFMHRTQDAKISLERMAEIHLHKDEESPGEKKATILPEKKSITLHNVSFQYEGPHSPMVLDGINMHIPESATTAIVGVSGSGKTTLIKLMLGMYAPLGGDIKVGELFLRNLSAKVWREKCGVVMQDGYIFSDTIVNNIIMGAEQLDEYRLVNSVKIANIQAFIESLPMGYNTKIGARGHGLSQGQKQRILIARAVYKNPEFIFFDEATNALDAGNEKVIIEQLNTFLSNKTAVIVAHRLSTVSHADQIIVLDKGRIVEHGTHAELTRMKGHYYNLVKNQLELGT